MTDICPVCHGSGLITKEERYTKAGEVAVRLKGKRPKYSWQVKCEACDGFDANVSGYGESIWSWSEPYPPKPKPVVYNSDSVWLESLQGPRWLKLSRLP
jgi:hypothetical protein